MRSPRHGFCCLQGVTVSIGAGKHSFKGAVKMSVENGKGHGFVADKLVIVIAGFLALGVLLPVVKDRMQGGARAAALGDLRCMVADLGNYHRDIGVWPECGMAVSDGTAATGEFAWFRPTGEVVHISSFLGVNEAEAQGWRGPYLTGRRADPWGHRYVVFVPAGKSDRISTGWVLSAGPDGIFQTGRNAPEIHGDDLGFIIQ